MDILSVVVGLLVGAVSGVFIMFYKNKSERGIAPHDLEKLKAEKQSASLEAEKYRERSILLKEQLESAQLNREKEQIAFRNSEARIAELQANNENLQNKFEEQKADLVHLQEKFNKDFELIANRILEEKTVKFTKLNQEKLQDVFGPLKERIDEFKKTVNDTYVKGSNERSALTQELKNLRELNKNLQDEAHNLTKALKGDSKTQGNWGEMVLERILEMSGLQKGREYDTQISITTSENKRYQPDVIVNLPDNKKVIIDSKVSLTAYEQYVNTDDEQEKTKYLAEHIQSLRNHFKGLDRKQYQDLYKIGSLDFILLFVPIESAFSLAIENKQDLFNEAFAANIVIVTPSTLLATLKTIANIWKNEYQSQNVVEIAEKAGSLYDKFIGFVEDMNELGSRIDQTNRSFSSAMNKLSEGRGNLIRRAEHIRKLGAKTSKQFPEDLLRKALDSDLDAGPN